MRPCPISFLVNVWTVIGLTEEVKSTISPRDVPEPVITTRGAAIRPIRSLRIEAVQSINPNVPVIQTSVASMRWANVIREKTVHSATVKGREHMRWQSE
jgi:hypothetical protein